MPHILVAWALALVQAQVVEVNDTWLILLLVAALELVPGKQA